MPSDRARFLHFFGLCALAQLLTGAVAWSAASFSLPPMLAVASLVLCSLALGAHFSGRYVEPRHFLRQVQHAIQTRQLRTAGTYTMRKRSTPSEEAALVVADSATRAAEPGMAAEGAVQPAADSSAPSSTVQASPIATAAPAESPVFPIDERWAMLTQREREVARGVGEGLTNKEIAARLVVTEFTVKKHLNNIFTKIGVRNRTELALFALEQEETDPSSSEV
jgi:DNA-binding CsgD family transcriptional regulator